MVLAWTLPAVQAVLRVLIAPVTRKRKMKELLSQRGALDCREGCTFYCGLGFVPETFN